jgi:hypothetical protein
MAYTQRRQSCGMWSCCSAAAMAGVGVLMNEVSFGYDVISGEINEAVPDGGSLRDAWRPFVNAR